MTADEARARCLALGMSAGACDETIADHMVDGAYCDGTIVLDASGKRCVSAATEDEVRRARAASPLPMRPSSLLPLGALALGAVVLVVLLARR